MKLGQFLNISNKFISFRISENKYFELQFSFFQTLTSYFEFKALYSNQTDHSGLYITLYIFKLFLINFSIYDCRHWGYDKGCWIEPISCNLGQTTQHVPDNLFNQEDYKNPDYTENN